MLAIAKERAAFLRLQDIIEFKESDAEGLDLANSSFDAALCRWGLMLIPNPDAAIGKIYSSLVSGGRFAAAVWAEEIKVPVLSLATRIIGSQIQMSVSIMASSRAASPYRSKECELAFSYQQYLEEHNRRIHQE
jgi:ubiquinone/menaquinone biosynthesis C-methylase UbiE